MSQVIFGTDGVRGTPGTYPLDIVTVRRLGAALAHEFGAESRLLVGRDTRESGAWVERHLATGITAAGGVLVSVGVMPTPGIAFLTTARDFSAGIVVSASHNPFPSNGIKVLTATGEKASRSLEERLEALVAADFDSWSVLDATAAPPTTVDMMDDYVTHLEGILSQVPALDGCRVAVDAAHGAVSRVAPRVLRELGFDVVEINARPDGRNINAASGSTHPEALQSVVVERQCRLGFAFDGDGDRVILVDHRGRLVDGDAVLFVCASHLKSTDRLTGNAIAATVMSNIGLEIALADMGITMHRCAVGDWHVHEEMLRHGLALGGEQSGHIIFSEFLPTGDGLATALYVLRVIAETGLELADLVGAFTTFPQVLVNVPVSEKRDLECVPEVADAIEAAERQLSGQGRVLVRYSGTESLLRIMIEGRDLAIVQKLADGIATRAREQLG